MFVGMTFPVWKREAGEVASAEVKSKCMGFTAVEVEPVWINGYL